VIFDTVGKLGWSVDVRHHVIRSVVTDVLGADDGDVPKAIIEEECIDCYKWEFGDYLEEEGL